MHILLCGDRDTGSDLLQSCALKALSSAKVPHEQGAMKSWLFQIMRNAWIDTYRRANVRAPELAPEILDDHRWDYDDRIIAEITMRQGMARLSAQHCEIIELVDLAGFGYAEAAAILAIPVGSMMSRLSRARLALLQAIEDENVRPLEQRRNG